VSPAGRVSGTQAEQASGIHAASPAAARRRPRLLFPSSLRSRSFLVEAPPNVCTPSHLAAAAKHIASLKPERFSLEVRRPELGALGSGRGLRAGGAGTCCARPVGPLKAGRGGARSLVPLHATLTQTRATHHPRPMQFTHPQVLEAEECAKLGMGCFLGVAEASHEPAKFIHLTYKPKGAAKHKARGPRGGVRCFLLLSLFSDSARVRAFRGLLRPHKITPPLAPRLAPPLAPPCPPLPPIDPPPRSPSSARA
jgi:hypothetical protein